jgi:hypothetical protein
LTAADGVITAFALASPKLAGEREEALAMLGYRKNLPPAGTVIVAGLTEPTLAGARSARLRCALHDGYRRRVVLLDTTEGRVRQIRWRLVSRWR